jgi:ADP-heptose:LPS heptosyltransferase
MTFPLINYLKLEHNLTLVCNEYVYEMVSYMQLNLKSKLLLVDELNNKIIIDFLSNKKSAEYIELSNPKLTIGFEDGFCDYDLQLKLPKKFNSYQASSIFLYALETLGLEYPLYLDFSCSQKWQFSNQTKIIIAPSAGNMARCHSIAEYITLGEKLNHKNIAFMIGPHDMEISSIIPKKFETIKSSNIQDTINVLATAKMVIACEGGFMHIAASYGIPLVGLFKVTSVGNWFPYDNKHQIGIGWNSNNKNNEATEFNMDFKLVTNKVNEIYESIKN